MVVICNNKYTSTKYENEFEKYPFPLSDFQKFAIESIIEGHHCLVTAHTGSGKTLPGEFAIKHFIAKGKKVVYTSPIKALSNQKYFEFSNKYPDISFGILKSIRNYNGSGNFYVYSSIYMSGELFKGITQIYPIKLLPHYLRINKKWKQSNPEIFLKNMKNTKYIGDNEYILEYCKINNSYNLPSEIRKIITDLPSQDIRLFYSRYNVHDLSVKKNIRYLSQLFACSEKTINIRLSNIHDELSFLLTI